MFNHWKRRSQELQAEEEVAAMVSRRNVEAMDREFAALQLIEQIGRGEWEPSQIAATMPIALIVDAIKRSN